MLSCVQLLATLGRKSLEISRFLYVSSAAVKRRPSSCHQSAEWQGNSQLLHIERPVPVRARHDVCTQWADASVWGRLKLQQLLGSWASFFMQSTCLQFHRFVFAWPCLAKFTRTAQFWPIFLVTTISIKAEPRQGGEHSVYCANASVNFLLDFLVLFNISPGNAACSTRCIERTEHNHSLASKSEPGWDGNENEYSLVVVQSSPSKNELVRFNQKQK